MSEECLIRLQVGVLFQVEFEATGSACVLRLRASPRAKYAYIKFDEPLNTFVTLSGLL